MGGGLAALAVLAARGAAASTLRARIGLQLFSLDAEMRRDLPGTLRQVRGMGYGNVELVGFYGLQPDVLHRQLRVADLRCISIHIRAHAFSPGAPSLEKDADTQLAMCRDLGLRYVVCPGPWFPERIVKTLPAAGLTRNDIIAAVARFTRADWQRSADLLNTMGKRARQAGLQFLYHNGNVEFVMVDGLPAFDFLLRETDPDLVKLELDCGWVATAGADPTHYLMTQPGRVLQVHLKDMLATPSNTAMRINSTDMGTGVIDWKRLLAAVDAAGVEIAYLEQEEPFVTPAIEAARRNYKFVKGLSF